MFLVFFFQAEDGIRDGRVTGVQTCALPISHSSHRLARRGQVDPVARAGAAHRAGALSSRPPVLAEIGRASCRERGEILVGAGSFKKKTRRSRRPGRHVLTWCGTNMTAEGTLCLYVYRRFARE